MAVGTLIGQDLGRVEYNQWPVTKRDNYKEALAVNLT